MALNFGKTKTLAIAALISAGMTGTSVADVYSCMFLLVDCQGAGQDCTQSEPLALKLVVKNDVWVLHDPDGGMINFTPVADEEGGVRTLLATNSDPDASATSMLSLFDDGQALLTTHGIFLTPAAITQVGTCQLEPN